MAGGDSVKVGGWNGRATGSNGRNSGVMTGPPTQTALARATEGQPKSNVAGQWRRRLVETSRKRSSTGGRRWQRQHTREMTAA